MVKSSTCMPASSNANQVEMSRWREYEYADIGLPSEYIHMHIVLYVYAIVGLCGTSYINEPQCQIPF